MSVVTLSVNTLSQYTHKVFEILFENIKKKDWKWTPHTKQNQLIECKRMQGRIQGKIELKKIPATNSVDHWSD